MSQEKIYALVDCNSFYASCEKLFRPDLKNKPVIVASNNDGCIVARSKEAKSLGIKMGVPVFKIRQLIESGHVELFSSNYALYADISARVMQTLEEFAPAVEVYSIDEAFLDLSSLPKTTSLTELGKRIRDTVKRNVGVPVCVGISATKTLAKLANHAAKTYEATGGVVDLTSRGRQRKLMGLLPVGEVWGVGSKISARLESLGIKTALQLADADKKFIRTHFSVIEERICNELNGIACIDFEEAAPAKKQIVCSRSFGERITAMADLRQAICNYASRASEKLRKELRLTKTITVFARTSAFNKTEPQYSNSATIRIINPTDDTRDIVTIAGTLLESIWRPGYRYAKAGVMLSDFVPRGIKQQDLFVAEGDSDSSRALMEVLDRINASGKGRVFLASQGVHKAWTMKRESLSPGYTTRWSELLVVK